MNTQMMGITKKLRSLGVDPDVLRMIRASVRKARAPQLTDAVIGRLRDEVSTHRRAILVLGRKGGYSVFSADGHAALCASTKRNKPWVSRYKKH